MSKINGTGTQRVTMKTLPDCDFCKHPTSGQRTIRKAAYDGKTIFGPWGYMCEEHYERNGVGLGTGLGQRLVLIASVN